MFVSKRKLFKQYKRQATLIAHKKCRATTFYGRHHARNAEKGVAIVSESL